MAIMKIGFDVPEKYVEIMKVLAGIWANGDVKKYALLNMLACLNADLEWATTEGYLPEQTYKRLLPIAIAVNAKTISPRASKA